ncbi:MAG TPA: WcaI family glycosyltransferase [Burkholderiaceae bacterium]|nr:WcaI family glycosyltransferase [Burkholderiaceae bacterium]
MKILLYGIHYAPELTGAGKATGELAAWLAESGHDVRVVTGHPFFPQWKRVSGLSSWRYAREDDRGVKVWRAPHIVPARPTATKRFLQGLSFALSSLPLLARQLAWRPDVVWVASPTLATAPGAWLLARACSARTWLHVRRLDTDRASATQAPPTLRQRVAAALERAALSLFDRVSAASQSMLARLHQRGVGFERLVLFPHWVDTNAVRPLAKPSALRRMYGIDDREVVALYAGALEEGRGLEVVANAARILERHTPVTFVFCGQGPDQDELDSWCDGLSNIRFLSLQPAALLNDLLNLADIHVLPMAPGRDDVAIPSKLVGMLASGRPVVATVRPDTPVARYVNERGLIVPPNDPHALAAALASLALAPGRRARLGQAARAFATRNTDIDFVLGRFERGLYDLLASSLPPSAHPYDLPVETAGEFRPMPRRGAGGASVLPEADVASDPRVSPAR